MKYLLIRHAEKNKEASDKDKDRPLSTRGHEQATDLGKSLVKLGIFPDIYLTSSYKHAQQTAEGIEQEIGFIIERQTEPRFQTIDALTPHGGPDDVKVLLDQADSASIDLHKYDTIAIIGHEARLSQLLTRLTSERERPFLRHTETVCLLADSLQNFLQGRGKLHFRIPVVDFQEEQLRPKVQSKLLVASLMAGFTSTILFQMLFQDTL